MAGMERSREKSLMELLLQSGRISEQALQKAQAEQQRSPDGLGNILVKQGALAEDELAQIMKGMLVVTFRLCGELFAFDAQFVREIIRWQPVSQLPQMPDFIEGIFRHRDMVIPVINLAQRLGKTPVPGNSESRIIVVEIALELFGLSVDGVEAVVQLPFDQMENSPAMLRGMEARYVQGIGKYEHNLITVLNLAGILEVVLNQGFHGMGRQA